MKQTCLFSPSHPPRALRRAMSFRSAAWKALGSTLLFLLTAVEMASGQAYNVSTLFGTPGVAGSADTQGTFRSVYQMARDSSGNVYVADLDASTVRKITPGGVVSTLAGLANNAGTVNGTGSAARFVAPFGVAVDDSGNLYVSDLNACVIRKVVISTGVVTTLAGVADTPGTSDGIATGRLNTPTYLACDGGSYLYCSDTSSYTLRRINIATGEITTIAGQAGSPGTVDGTGTTARFTWPVGCAVDGNGNIILADNNSHTIRQVTPGGIVTTIAGLPLSPGTADGTGASARFYLPYGLDVDRSTNTIFVTDFGNHTLRRILPGGVVSTICGLPGAAGAVNGTGSNVRLTYPNSVLFDGTSNTLVVGEGGMGAIRRVTLGGSTSWWVGTPGKNGVADSTGSFSGPYSTAVDKAGNVYVADAGNHVIRKVTPAGDVTTLAGVVGSPGSTNGTGSAARFNNPSAVTVDASGNVFVGDTFNHTVRKITAGGTVTTIAGQAGASGNADGTGATARFNKPYGIAVDATGTNLYVTNFNTHTVRKVVIATGAVTTLAGSGGNAGSTDGVGAAARFDGPVGIVIDPSGANLYVADFSSHIIRKLVLATNAVTTVAGSANTNGKNDGIGSAARFDNPRALAFDSAGNLFITESGNDAVRKMTPAALVSTLAGGTSGAQDGVGNNARFDNPAGVCVDSGGNLFIGDQGNHAIRKVTPGGVVSTFAGTAGLAGTFTAGAFDQPSGIVRDSAGNFYVAEVGNHVIRKVTPNGSVSTLAGLAGSFGSANGTGGAARFNAPRYLTIDSGGNLYVSDTGNHTIRKVTSSGVVTTLAGTSGVAGSVDGTGAAARFDSPYGIAIDSTGTNLYLADNANHTIRKVVVATGVVTTIAGSAGNFAEVDGVGSAARFRSPIAVAIDAANANLYVCDYDGQTVRKVVLSSNTVTTLAGLANTPAEVDGTGSAARFDYPIGIAVSPNGNLFVSDNGGKTLRRVTTAGVVTTVAGLASNSGFADGIGSAARFGIPKGMCFDAAGVMYLADQGNNVIRKAVRASAKAQMISPANGSVLVDPVTTFTWDKGDGATGYALWVGTTPGAYDLYAGIEGTNTSKTVTLPANTKIYVTLHSLISGAYQSNSYVYEAVPASKAVLTSHADGATLSSAALNLQWSPGVGCSGYAVWLGSSVGGYDLGAIALPAGTTTWSKNVPADGGPIYITLWSLINGAYQGNSYWVQAAALDTPRPARIINITNTSQLSSGSASFTWGGSVGGSGFALWVGSTPDGYDLYAGILGNLGGKTVTVPTDGRRIYVTLHTLIGGAYQSNAYWFTAANIAAPSSAAKLTSHVNGATLAGAATTLTWGAISGATKYYLWVGTKPAAYDLYAGDEGANLTKSLNMPVDGRPVYVTLYTDKGGQLYSNSYWFTCANTGGGNKPALITNPTLNGTGIPGNVTLQWSTGTGVTSYALWVGSSPGGYDLYAADEGVGTSRTLNLPTDGRMVYVSLHSLIGGVYQSLTYQYRLIGMTPLGLVSPVPGTSFTSKSATFQWQGGASQYALWIGSAPRAYDIYAGVEGTNTSKAITNLLPSDGRPVYVTIYSMVNGVWQPSDSIYNAWQQP